MNQLSLDVGVLSDVAPNRMHSRQTSASRPGNLAVPPRQPHNSPDRVLPATNPMKQQDNHLCP